jgi:putative peptidoglycan lipid II flippase
LTHTQTHKKQILKSASIISIITVVSRILGYVRDQRLTLLLGTTGIADSFVLAYRIPNLLRRLVGEGSMTASFIPVFSDYMRNRSREETWAFANRLFWTFSVVLAGLTVLGVIFSPLIVRMFSMFGRNQVQIEAVYLNRLMFPYILFIGMAALAMGILNCFHIFGMPAATPILLNVFPPLRCGDIFRVRRQRSRSAYWWAEFCSFFFRCRNWSERE